MTTKEAAKPAVARRKSPIAKSRASKMRKPKSRDGKANHRPFTGVKNRGALMRLILCLLAFLFPIAAFGQSTILQSGPTTPGHVPMFVGVGTMQPIVQDSGTSGGGGPSVGISELGVTIRNPLNVYPAAGVGNGPYNTNICDYDAPTTNATGYHFICISPNSLGGELIAVGAGGGASNLPLLINVNGTSYSFPFTVGGIVGPVTTTSGDLAVWNNTTGTLLKDVSQVTLAQLPTLLTNQLYANVTSGSATPLGFSMPSCSTAASYLQWTTNTGPTCGTAIAAPAGSLSGATINATVVTSSLTSVGTLTGGSTGAGFTIALTTSTLTGNIPCARNDGPYTGDITKTQGSCATTVSSIAGTAVGAPTGTATTGVVLAGTPTITTPNIVGQAGGNAPATGSLGEYLSTSVATSAVSLTTATPKDIGTLVISAGYWLCSANVSLAPASGTTTTVLAMGVSTTINTLPTAPAGGAFAQVATGTGLTTTANSLNTGAFLENVGVSTTLHLVGLAYFATSTMTAGGFIGCMRMN